MFVSGSDGFFLVFPREVVSVEFTEVGGQREEYFSRVPPS